MSARKRLPEFTSVEDLRKALSDGLKEDQARQQADLDNEVSELVEKIKKMAVRETYENGGHFVDCSTLFEEFSALKKPYVRQAVKKLLVKEYGFKVDEFSNGMRVIWFESSKDSAK